MAGGAVELRQQQQASIYQRLVGILRDVELVEGVNEGVIDRLCLERMGERWRRAEEKGSECQR